MKHVCTCTHIIHEQLKCAPGQNFPLVDPCSEKLKWERASILWNDAISSSQSLSRLCRYDQLQYDVGGI